MSKILLSGGCVLTLGAKTPNFARADVLIDGETVAEIGTGLRARDAEQVDASDTSSCPASSTPIAMHGHRCSGTWVSPLRTDERRGPPPSRSPPARRCVCGHPDRLVGCRRGRDHHRRRLVAHRVGRRARRRRAPGPHRLGAADRLRRRRRPRKRDDGPPITPRRRPAPLSALRDRSPLIAFGSVVTRGHRLGPARRRLGDGS